MNVYTNKIRETSKKRSLFIIVLRMKIQKVRSSPIVTTWSLNLCGGMALVKWSANICLVLICSITTFFSLKCSFMARYLMSMCLLQLPLFFALSHKDNNWIVTIYLQWRRNWTDKSKPINETLQPYFMLGSLKTWTELILHNGGNS